MLGCDLPGLAYRFKGIEELVPAGKTGMLFTDADELAKSLFALSFTSWGPNSRSRMSGYFVETFSSPAMRWQEGWERNALDRLQDEHRPLISQAPSGASASPRVPDYPLVWDATIMGPESTPWEGGLYTLELVGKTPRVTTALYVAA
jgi:Ubiquitin-conjugating enzyme